jgi:asparagine synthase (glutamine-hydrolysing)
MQANQSTLRAPLSTGAPRFANAALASTLTQQGSLAAWQQAYAQSGVQALSEVSGEFAVALPLGGDGAFLAVDRFAVKSLCYRINDGQLRYAERADTLADTATPIDPQAIYDYLFFHAIPSPRTIYRGIFRLPPGHYALFIEGKLTVASYWTPQFTEPSAANFDELKVEFLSIVRAAVKERIPSGARPACFLSGGTDSSTVAGMQAEISGQAPASYSIGFEAEGYDEMAYARIAAKRFGCEHHEYYVTPADLVRSIPDVAAYYDQPFGNSSAVPAFYCALQAKKDGIHSMQAGDGGDELFGGNTRYAKERVFDWYGHIPSGLRSGLMEPLLDNDLARRVPLVRKAASYVNQARVPMPDRMQTYNLLYRLGIDDVLSPAFLAQVNTDGPRLAQREVWDAGPSCSLVNRMLAFDWRYTLAENDLPKVVGTTQMAGVDVGFPLLDSRLLDFSLNLPTAYKLKGFKLRWFFKEALRGFLPDEILVKKKHGFGLPFGVWAVKDEALNALAAESLRGIAARGLVNSAFVESLLTHRLKEHAGYYGEMVWILMMLEQWLRRHAPDYKCN